MAEDPASSGLSSGRARNAAWSAPRRPAVAQVGAELTRQRSRRQGRSWGGDHTARRPSRSRDAQSRSNSPYSIPRRIFSWTRGRGGGDARGTTLCSPPPLEAAELAAHRAVKAPASWPTSSLPADGRQRGAIDLANAAPQRRDRIVQPAPRSAPCRAVADHRAAGRAARPRGCSSSATKAGDWPISGGGFVSQVHSSTPRDSMISNPSRPH